jgi:CubicO group peptidase (beta-lactamase class C family)
MKIRFLRYLTLINLIIGCLILTRCSTPVQTPYNYNDGLTRSTPEEQGVPSNTIAGFFQKIQEKGYNIHGLMILRHGKVIAEHWWSPYDPQYQHAMYSATKTFTSMAIGFAVQEGLLNIDDKVVKYFPEELPDSISSRLAMLSIKHLLTMSVGHEASPSFFNSSDPVRLFFSIPFAHEPGTVFSYDILASHMLSRIISKISGETLYDYLKPRLFDPLGIKDVVWEFDKEGYTLGNGGSHMRTSDLAKLGLFLLNKGKWNGQQLLNPGWIEEATTPHIYQNPKLTTEDREKAINDAEQGYGYQIWMGRHNSYRAAGGQSQLVIVVPEYDLVIVNHGSFGDDAGYHDLIFDMLPFMSNKKLKPEKSFDLNTAIAGYETKRPFSDTSIYKVTLCTRRYVMESSTTDIRSVMFRFDSSGNCFLTFVTSGAVHNIPFGLDSWLYGTTDRTLSALSTGYPNKMGVTPFNTAGICTWTAPEKLSAYCLSMFNPGAEETFKFTFDKDKLNIEIVPPSRSPMAPRGIAQQETIKIVLTGTKTKD